MKKTDKYSLWFDKDKIMAKKDKELLIVAIIASVLSILIYFLTKGASQTILLLIINLMAVVIFIMMLKSDKDKKKLPQTLTIKEQSLTIDGHSFIDEKILEINITSNNVKGLFKKRILKIKSAKEEYFYYLGPSNGIKEEEYLKLVEALKDKYQSKLRLI